MVKIIYVCEFCASEDPCKCSHTTKVYQCEKCSSEGYDENEAKECCENEK